MPYDYPTIIRAQFDGLQLDRQRTQTEMERCRLCEDEDGTMYAANALLEINAKLAALDNVAKNYVTAQHLPANRYGLTQDEIEIANGIAGSDPHMTQDQRQQLYLQNKQKLQYMRATGQYRDDQGTVRR